jgi:Zn finger protein HypA/HybF involved in hydrogenase expression
MTDQHAEIDAGDICPWLSETTGRCLRCDGECVASSQHMPSEPKVETDHTPSPSDVAGKCPSCGRASLRLAAGNHVTCMRLECPEPTLADDILHDEVTW